VVLLGVAFATVIGVGLGLGTERAPRLRRTTLALTGTLLTIPSFALFGLLIPILGLGLAPTIVTLTVYGVFPILRNTVTGLEGVEPAVVDAARGMGMGSWQRLRLVRLPLAWPVILNGIHLKKNNIVWLPPAPANNTYAIVASKEKAAALGVSTISNYAKLATSDPAKASFCGASEFFGRGDGWPGVQKSYGFTLPKANTAELAAGPIYNSIDKSDPCTFGEVFATDGRVEALGLTVLKDDKNFFAVYNPALTVRKDVADKNPKMRAVIAPIAAALDDATLRSLNAKVDVVGDTPEVVAKAWLQQKGFIK